MDEILWDTLPELIATLVGIFIGSLAALAANRRQVRKEKQRRKALTLRNLLDELEENYNALRAVERAYRETPYGKSVYISSIAWETAVSAGDLPDVIGAELADQIENQYALLLRLRYYVNLLTELWFAPRDIEGYERIRDGFRNNILSVLSRVLRHHGAVRDRIQQALDDNPMTTPAAEASDGTERTVTRYDVTGPGS